MKKISFCRVCLASQSDEKMLELTREELAVAERKKCVQSVSISSLYRCFRLSDSFDRPSLD